MQSNIRFSSAALPCSITLGAHQQLGNCTTFALGETCTIGCAKGYYSTDPAKAVNCAVNGTETIPESLCAGTSEPC
jgi:hypothetical protein